VELFHAWLTAEFDLLPVVDFRDGISHRIEFVAAYKADREGIRLLVRRSCDRSAASRGEKKHEGRIESVFGFHENGNQRGKCGGMGF